MKKELNHSENNLKYDQQLNASNPIAEPNGLWQEKIALLTRLKYINMIKVPKNSDCLV